MSDHTRELSWAIAQFVIAVMLALMLLLLWWRW